MCHRNVDPNFLLCLYFWLLNESKWNSIIEDVLVVFNDQIQEVIPSLIIVLLFFKVMCDLVCYLSGYLVSYYRN